MLLPWLLSEEPPSTRRRLRSAPALSSSCAGRRADGLITSSFPPRAFGLLEGGLRFGLLADDPVCSRDTRRQDFTTRFGYAPKMRLRRPYFGGTMSRIYAISLNQSIQLNFFRRRGICPRLQPWHRTTLQQSSINCSVGGTTCYANCAPFWSSRLRRCIKACSVLERRPLVDASTAFGTRRIAR